MAFLKVMHKTEVKAIGRYLEVAVGTVCDLGIGAILTLRQVDGDLHKVNELLKISDILGASSR